MNRRWVTSAVLGAGLGLLAVVVAASENVEPESVPPGVEQILERGKIPAVFDPQFVTADEAEIPDDAWVLGVVMGGEARAYSLNLLNHHEVVNDRVGEHPIAAVW